MDNLGMQSASKIKVKKLVMAARRLATTRADMDFAAPPFDAKERYQIEWDDKPKLIPGMRLAVAYMVSSNLPHVAVQCRCDYAYGAEGYRKRNGEELIPPFASLKFDIDLVEPPTC